MQPPLIGISMYDRSPKTNQELGSTFFVPCDYVDVIREAGGVPVLLPPGETQIETIQSRLDGVVIAGGGDVNPALYGAHRHPKTGGVDDERDALEMALIRSFVEHQRPLLGICRGAQIVNVTLGGTLIQHLPDVVDGTVPHVAPDGNFIDHAVSLDQYTRLGAMLEVSSLSAPSSHHQAIDTLGRGLRVSATAADGVIEAIEHTSHPWLIAVQWHPERAAHAPEQKRLLHEFVRACSQS